MKQKKNYQDLPARYPVTQKQTFDIFMESTDITRPKKL